MPTIPIISDHVVAELANAVEEAATHDALTQTFGLPLADAGISKAKRLRAHMKAMQSQYRAANGPLDLVARLLAPVRFRNDPVNHRRLCESANQVLAFIGVQVDEQGRIVASATARTITDAQRIAQALRRSLGERKIHPDVLRFCTEELIARDDFHAVLEAMKSIAEKVRRRSGLREDGAELFTTAFLGKSPRLALNTLASPTEQSEQRGFGNLLIGLAGMYRNVTAHAARVLWPMDGDETLDVLTTASLVHRRLDLVQPTPSGFIIP